MSTPGIPQRIRGTLDGLIGGLVGGWATDAGSPDGRVEVEVLIDGEVVGRSVADRYRQDLAEAGVGTGHCGWVVPIALEDWRDGHAHELRARATGTDLELDGSPQLLVIGEQPRPRRVLAPFAADTILETTGSVDAVRGRLVDHGRVAVVATYQPDPEPPTHLLTYLRALRDLGTAVVVVDTTRGGLRLPDDVADLRLHRENVGWDFASWLAGLHALRPVLDDAQELLLTNDSVFGPLHPLQQSWDHPRIAGADFWGITDSWAIRYHLQSYFVVLRRSVLDHPAFWTFLEVYGFPAEKRQVVREGEVGLTVALHAAGLRSAVTCPYDVVARAWLDDLPERLRRVADYPENRFLDQSRLDQAVGTVSAAQSLRHLLEAAHHLRRGLPLNGSHFFWDTLVTEFRAPFVKRELLHVNPAEIPFATELSRVLAATGYDVEHVRDAARRANEPRVVTI